MFQPKGYNTEIGKERGSSYQKKWRDLQMEGTHKHLEASLKCFDNHRCLLKSEGKD